MNYTKQQYESMVKDLNYTVDLNNKKAVIRTGKTVLLLHKLCKKDHNTRILSRTDFLKIKTLTMASGLKPYSIIDGAVYYD